MSTSTVVPTPLTAEELAGIDAYWRAANYLSVGQIYLLDNPLLRSRSYWTMSSRRHRQAPRRTLGMLGVGLESGPVLLVAAPQYGRPPG